VADVAFTVGELSRLTGVTVRALHHYDEIGLVRPSQRSAAGYRLYGDADVRRLQQVLAFRELGLPLDQIAHAIDSARGRHELDALLRTHRDTLVVERARIDAMIASLDAALGGHTVTTEDDVKKLFQGFDPAAYEDEAKARWGSTDAYAESAKRTRSYGVAEWDEIHSDQAKIYARLAERMRAGASVSEPTVQALVDEHRRHIDRRFYPCSVEMHKRLGEMYVADARFTANLDAIAPGFAAFLSEAIAAS
jgi:DNA-binding transcriptional MerR regulator